MPGELLPTMAAPAVAKSKLSRGKPDLYLIVSSLPAESYKQKSEADLFAVRRRHDLRARYFEGSGKYQAVAGVHRVEASAWKYS
jgi:hypothetical protein